MSDDLIRFSCVCGCRMKAAAKLIGRSAKCPKCGASVVVSPAVTTRPDPTPPPPPKAPPKIAAKPPLPPVAERVATPQPVAATARTPNKTLRILKKSLLRNVPAVICLVGMGVFLILRGVSVYRGDAENAATISNSPVTTAPPARVIEQPVELSTDQKVAAAAEAVALDMAYENARKAGMEPTDHETPIVRRRAVPGKGVAWSVRLQIRVPTQADRGAWISLGYLFWVPDEGESEHWRTYLNDHVGFSDRNIDRLLRKVPPDHTWEEFPLAR